MPLLDQAKTQVTLYDSKSRSRVVKVKRFCIDDDSEREAYEKLATRVSTGEIRFIKEPTEVYSQKTDRFYIVATWEERQ